MQISNLQQAKIKHRTLMKYSYNAYITTSLPFQTLNFNQVHHAHLQMPYQSIYL